MFIVKDFKDYEIIDSSNGMKLERWKDIYLLRPDPEIIWDNGNLLEKYSSKINAVYHRSNKGGGYWENLKDTKAFWQVAYKDLKFNIKEMGFKHTGLFPEQASNWDYLMNIIKNSKRNIKVLNLFGYTGGASVAALKAGASVVHVDASKGMVDWCKDNVKLNGLSERPIRYIVDDCIKFVSREIRRGNKYDVIIMDPPSYGRGANKEVWDITKDLDKLLRLCNELLSDNPLCFIINSYTGGLSKEILVNMINLILKPNHNIKVNVDSLCLPIKENNLILPCGITGRVEYDD